MAGSIISNFNRIIKRALKVDERSRSDDEKMWSALLRVRTMPKSATSEVAEFMCFCKERLNESNAQVFQDLFVLFETSSKREGFFVEFGATDGIALSNTFLLEASYGWNGILVEPAKVWQKALQNNRRCSIDYRCVSARSGETILFNEAQLPELSTIDEFSGRDRLAKWRISGKRYRIESVSLNDLLDKYNAPPEFEYLSVDTEGSELSILSNLNFTKYRPRIITVEHNFATASRQAINALLSSHGYLRKFSELSLYDDWYVRSF
jgi:FkbM family methyltransferase